MATDPDDRLSTAQRFIRRDGLSGLMVGLLGGTFMTVTYTFWSFVESIGSTFMRPFQAFAGSLATLIRGSIGGPVVLLEASIQTGVESVTEGLFATFGIFAYPITMIAVMAGIWVFAQAWDRIDLSPWNFLRRMR